MFGNVVTGGYRAYQIQKSLRFRRSAPGYLTRVFGAGGNTTTWTLSAWFKRGDMSTNFILSYLFYNSTGPVNNQCHVGFNGSNQLMFTQSTQAGTTCSKVTSAVYRDPSAWMHVVAVWDTGNATASDRMRLYVNGQRITAFATSIDPGLNLNSYINSVSTQSIGGQFDTNGQLGLASNSDEYLADVIFIGGQALTADSFGFNNPITGQWAAKAYTGTYGTNGFYLKFNDGSSLTNLCLDRSGNGNNWTATNVSLTAGVTYDWMVDTPTVNYCTLNPLVPVATPSTYSNGNLTATTASSAFSLTTASIAMPSGSWYCEVKFSSLAIGAFVGIRSAAETTSSYVGGTSASYGYYSTNGNKYNAGTPTAYGSSYTTAHTIGIAFDATAGTLEFYRDNTSQGVAFTSIPAADYVFAVADEGTGSVTFDINFGQRPFTYTPPTGFKALNTANMPAVAIPNGRKHFDVLTHAGNGGTQSLTMAQFQPDFAWIKSRSSGTQSHQLFDSVRGVSKNLNSSNTGAEASTPGTGLTAFNSNGITLVDDTAGNNWVNGSTGSPTYVDWLWKAGNSTVINNQGSITSNVSANIAAGFSIVTYTGTGANATVGHGLGVAPKMVIVKQRSVAATWGVYHEALGADKYLILNTTAAQVTNTMWNNTAPTSGVFSLGAAGFGVNDSAVTAVAYCFAEVPGFSKIGSYTGNGSADGPFVYCGFRPRWVAYKRTNTTGNWIIYDTSRSPYNEPAAALYPNLSNAEDVSHPSDFLANGFKLRSTGLDSNASGGTYIFMAFAEVPFQYANAR